MTSAAGGRRRPRRAGRTVLGGLALASAGCRLPDDPPDPSVSYTVRAQQTGPQSAPAGAVLAEPLTVLVTDSLGLPVRGVTVRYRVVGGRGAVVLDSLVVTGSGGIAAAWVRVGTEADTATVTAAVPGQENGAARFTLVATPGPRLRAVEPASFAPGDTITLRGVRLAAPPGGPLALPSPGAGADGLLGFVGTARARVVAVSGDTLVRLVVPPCLPTGTQGVAVRVGSVATNAVEARVEGEGRAIALAPFEAVTAVAPDASGCLRLRGDGARYLVLPQFAAVDSTPLTRAYALHVDGAAASISVGAADVDGRRAVAPRTRAGTPREGFERMLRDTERALARGGIGADVHRGDELAPLFGRRAPEPPALGSERPFRVLTRIDGTAFGTAVGRLRYAGAHILIYEDRTAPAPLDEATLRALGDLVDGTLYPLDVRTFGTESDVDANGRVIVLLTPMVNALTPAARCGSDGFVPGFFYGADLGTRNQNSNRGEIFYALVPDPQATRSCAHDLAEVLRLLPANFLHEFQHMISFNQHVLVRRGAEESPWLNEGLSHMAEELGARLYEARYPAPAGRRVATQLLPDSAIPFLRGNVANALLYLASPTAHSVTTFRDFGTLEERGAVWLFLHWLTAQKGSAALGRLVQSPRTGRQNVEEVAQEPFATLFADFVTALAADSVPGVPRARIPARYRVGERSLRTLLTRSLGTMPRWPLMLKPAPFGGEPALGAMVQGTFDPYDLTALAGRPLSLRFTTANGGPFPAAAGAQVTVLRIDP